MKTRKSVDWWGIGIICIAFFLRVFRIETLTEFLGDQGRTMLTMRAFLEGGSVPLVGPSTLSGHNLGPVFYYLLVPGYPGGPVGESLWMAIFGVAAVVVMYKTSLLMFGKWPSRISSLLWAVSPLIVSADRIIWEPNLVPFFAVLYIYLLYIAHRTWIPWIWAALGFVVGVLIQLHYPNVYFIGLTVLYLGGSMLLQLRRFALTVAAGLWWFAGFFLALVPFLLYEYTHGFENVLGVLSIIQTGGGIALGKRVMLGLALDYSFRVFGRVLPYMTHSMAPFIVAIWGIFVFFAPSKKNIFFSLWFFGGLVAMARYSGVVYDHYLNFLTPVPFFIIAAFLAFAEKKRWRNAALGFVGLLCMLQIIQTDVFSPGVNDIARVRGAVSEIQAISGLSPFSFTLTGSRSYSDLHYRYYMEVMNVHPVSFDDIAHNNFMLVCDRKNCPEVSEIVKLPELPVLCFEEHCKEIYPKIQLQKVWKYQRDIEIGKGKTDLGRLYIFDRR